MHLRLCAHVLVGTTLQMDITLVAHEKSSVHNAYELSNECWLSMAKVKAIIRSFCALSFATQINSQLVANASWPNVIKTKITAM